MKVKFREQGGHKNEGHKAPREDRHLYLRAVLSYTDEDVKRDGNNFFHEVEEYIECPCCERRITLRTSSSCGRPYD